MCVIFVVDGERPSAAEVRAAFQCNDAGGGVAWRGDGKVHWEKGLDEEEMVVRVAELPVPFVAHFRIPSCGGPYDVLCHPFPVHRDVPLVLKGSTKGNVLFHNGHWRDWDKKVLDWALRGNLKIPKGRWSDTRAMAWAAAHLGDGILPLIEEKVVLFGPDECQVYGTVGHLGWSKFDNKYLVSNRHFEHAIGRPKYPSTTTRESKDKEEPSGTRRGIGAGGSGFKQLPSGGAHLDQLPFGVVLQMYERGQIGKKRFKKLRKLFDRRQAELMLKQAASHVLDQTTLH